MMMSRTFALAAILAVGSWQSAGAQTVTTKSSTEYERSGFWRFWFGEAWRPTWFGQLEVPVLDLGAYAGGLEPFKKGGNQTRTLRMHGADGRTYIFRSTDKNVARAMPDDLKDTPIGTVIQDQTASMHPTGSLAVAVLQEAVGVLHAPPTLVWLPDDPRLGEFREEYRNMLGQIEERPDEAEEGKTFAGAEKIVGADKLLEKLEESMEDRLDTREYLVARLIDFIVGDTDRGADQWRWAKIEAGKRDVYRPIPRDRDYAFMRTEGLLIKVAAMLYPKLVRYGEKYPGLNSLVFMTQDFDRAHLVDLPWAAWDSAVTAIQQRLTNDVITRAVGVLPATHQRTSGAVITAALLARRDNLREIARRYYIMVNEDADVFGSDEDETADVERHADGSVTVRIWREGAGGGVAPIAALPAPTEAGTDGTYEFEPVFERRFTPDVTQEIRIYLDRGNDRAIVRGDVERSIEIRVIGGEGDDVLVDSSRVARGDKTSFYDAHGNNTIVRGPNTRVMLQSHQVSRPRLSEDDEEAEEKNTRILSEERRGRFRDLQNAQADFIEQKTKSVDARTWGKENSNRLLLEYREGSGVVVGYGPTITDYGFRRRPHEWQASLRAMVGTLSGDVGVRLTADRYFEATPWSASLFAHATQIESNRFFGWGNDTEDVDRSGTLVKRDEVMVHPALRYALGRAARFSFGPVARWVNTDSAYGQVGARAELLIDRATTGGRRQSGFTVRAGGSTYPAIWDVTETFGTAHGVAQLYVPLGWPTLALRAGGQRVWGDDFPLHEAAFIGGNTTVRGFFWNRFAGDAAAFGTAELRVPITRLTLLTRGDLSFIGFTDAGRVWFDGESPGGWHTSTGGGLAFASLGQALSVTYAKGEEGRVYLTFGLPF